jgi:hypothetical protein
MYNYQLAEAGAVNNLQPTELDYDPPGIGKKPGYFLGKCRSFVAVGKAAPAVKNRDITDCADFQI